MFYLYISLLVIFIIILIFLLGRIIVRKRKMRNEEIKGINSRMKTEKEMNIKKKEDDIIITIKSSNHNEKIYNTNSYPFLKGFRLLKNKLTKCNSINYSTRNKEEIENLSIEDYKNKSNPNFFDINKNNFDIIKGNDISILNKKLQIIEKIPSISNNLVEEDIKENLNNLELSNISVNNLESSNISVNNLVSENENKKEIISQQIISEKDINYKFDNIENFYDKYDIENNNIFSELNDNKSPTKYLFVSNLHTNSGNGNSNKNDINWPDMKLLYSEEENEKFDKYNKEKAQSKAKSENFKIEDFIKFSNKKYEKNEIKSFQELEFPHGKCELFEEFKPSNFNLEQIKFKLNRTIENKIYPNKIKSTIYHK
jgi:hypothetical protein